MQATVKLQRDKSPFFRHPCAAAIRGIRWGTHFGVRWDTHLASELATELATEDAGKHVLEKLRCFSRERMISNY